MDRKLLEYPMETKGKDKASSEPQIAEDHGEKNKTTAPELRQIAGPTPVRGLLPPLEGRDGLAKEREMLLKNPQVADWVAKGLITLPSHPDVPPPPPGRVHPEDKSGNPSQSTTQHNAARSSPAGAGESRQNPIQIGIKKEEDGDDSVGPPLKEEDVTDMDIDGESISSSETDDEGTVMIHPGLRNGITLFGKVMFVRPMGRGAYRVFLNAGTDKKPFLIVRNGSDFPRGFAEDWFQNPDLRSESDKPKGWKAESFRSVDFIQTEDPAKGARRAPPAYIYGFENQKPALWTKTEFIMRCGKSSAMNEIQKRITRRKARQMDLANARDQRVHPDTGTPLTQCDRESTPWLSRDIGALDTSASVGATRFTKIISSDDEDTGDVKAVKKEESVKRESLPKREDSAKREGPASTEVDILKAEMGTMTAMLLKIQKQLDTLSV